MSYGACPNCGVGNHPKTQRERSPDGLTHCGSCGMSSKSSGWLPMKSVDYGTIKAVDGRVVERLGRAHGNFPPSEARERAARLIAAAEEAESVPRSTRMAREHEAAIRALCRLVEREKWDGLTLDTLGCAYDVNIAIRLLVAEGRMRWCKSDAGPRTHVQFINNGSMVPTRHAAALDALETLIRNGKSDRHTPGFYPDTDCTEPAIAVMIDAGRMVRCCDDGYARFVTPPKRLLSDEQVEDIARIVDSVAFVSNASAKRMFAELRDYLTSLTEAE